MECHRVLADGEPIYRLPGLDGRFRNWCASCGALRVSRLDLTEPAPCEVCGRPVVSPESRRLHLHVTCGETSCYRAMRAARARDRHQPPRVCPCGGEFKPKRADARYFAGLPAKGRQWCRPLRFTPELD